MSKPKDMNPTPEEIQIRAYEIYLRRGGEAGRADEDWLAAEEGLRFERKQEQTQPSSQERSTATPPHSRAANR